MNALAQKDAVEQFKAQIANRESDFKMALPAHIPVERFVRVVMTAVIGNRDLLQADRISLFESAMKAAQDGLLPDGREGALVIYNTKIKERGEERWIKKVQWMPMIAGILKKVRNSGELSTIVARVVYAGDKFRNWIDDNGEHIEYEAGEEQDRNIVRRVFAMAKLKDGSIEVEPLSPDDIEKIRSASKSKDKGPWVDWWEEMAKKSALRRLAKRLPISTDLDDLIRRDDALYDFDGARGQAQEETSRPKTLAGRLDALAGVDPETGEVIGHDAGVAPAQETDAGQPKQPAPQEAAAEAAGGKRPPDMHASGAAAAAPEEGSRVADDDRSRVADDDPFAGKSSAWREGWTAAEKGTPKDRPPAHIAEDDELADFREGFEAWWAQHEGAGRKRGRA
ncbi:recombinase RecT [Methylocystis rosea]|uniref:recombinase RecT n=1 Tax=Methylocystis rosea TaxID=173366 RepID=UPI000376C717|nr:recombinase RecT [Methylocystis rosea]